MILLLMGLGGGFGTVLFFGSLAALAFWLGRRDGRPAPHRTVSRFRVSPQAIELQGRTFSKRDIHRLLLRNGKTSHESSLVIVPGQPGAVSAAAREQHDARVAQVCYGLTVEAGGKAYLLAGGMDETTAFGLLQEVTRILGADSR
jgi:hypothetical protein